MWLRIVTFLSLAFAVFGQSSYPDFVKRIMKEIEGFDDRACMNMDAEIVVIIDSSRSISYEDFDKQIEFLKTFVTHFKIGPKHVRFGAITFGKKIIEKNTFFLNQYTDESSLVTGISNIEHDMENGGSTQTGKAIKYAYENLFKNARKGIQKIAIVITDGQSTDPEGTEIESETARNKGITMFTVGVGKNVSMEELEVITGRSDFVFKIESYSEFSYISKELKNNVCKPCKTIANEIVLIIDSSASINPKDFNQQIQFLKEFVSRFAIGPKHVRFGAVTFGSQIIAENTFFLDRYTDRSSLVLGISKIKHLARYGGSTQTGKAIKYAYGNLFKYARKGIKKIAIVITDGQSTDPEETKIEAESARNKGIAMLAVGVGKNVSQEELKVITGRSDYVFRIDSYRMFDKINKQLTKKACEPPKEEPCDKNIDINFVFDSAKLNYEDTEYISKFIKSSISNWYPHKSNIRFGIYTPPCKSINGFSINSYPTQAEVSTYFDQFHQTTFASIMTKTYQNSFTARMGSRKNSRKVAVMFLKGKIMKPMQAKKAVAAARRAGVELFIIKMDDLNFMDTLEMITSRKPFTHILGPISTVNPASLSGEFLNRLCKM